MKNKRFKRPRRSEQKPSNFRRYSQQSSPFAKYLTNITNECELNSPITTSSQLSANDSFSLLLEDYSRPLEQYSSPCFSSLEASESHSAFLMDVQHVYNTVTAIPVESQASSYLCTLQELYDIQTAIDAVHELPTTTDSELQDILEPANTFDESGWTLSYESMDVAMFTDTCH